MQFHRVDFMPKALEPGLFYVAEAFGAAAHLCACGCGTRIRTPLGPTEWSFEDGPRGLSVSPSVGNWQRPCRSHYWITNGEIVWSAPWTEQQVEAGRNAEHARRLAYYADRRQGPLSRLLHRFARFFRR
jgi:hypothetical protein